MKPSEVATAAAERVERGWCQGRIATNARGSEVDFDSPIACSFSIIGSIASVSTVWFDFIADECRMVNGCRSLSGWNDAPDRQQHEVVAALREAARRLRERGL